MSTTAIVCPSCRVSLRLKAKATGRKVRCPRCGNIFVPGMSPPPSPEQKDTPSANAHHGTIGLDGWSVRSTDSFLRPPQATDELGRLGSYRVLKVLGQGGMGRVYQAEDTLLQRQVALKVLLPRFAGNPKARLRFLREARAAAALEHDNIVAIHQVGEDNGVPFLAMPLLKGESLEVCLGRDSRLPLAETLRIGREIAEGLSAAHERGLIHRDIKPANLWLEGSRRRVKILDFGLARPATGDSDKPVTKAGTILGTPAYMAPEQARGEAVDSRCDLFSLGCVLHRMVIGEPPFRGENVMAVLTSLATDVPQALTERNPEVPPELSDLVMRLLAKDREGRPASAQVVAEELTALMARVQPTMPMQAEVEPVKVSRTSRPAARRRRRAWMAATGIVLAAVVVLGAIFTLRTKNGTLVVKVSEPDVQVFIDGEEKITIDSEKVGRVELAPGEHRLIVRRGAEELHTASFTLKSGGEVVLDAEWKPKQAAAAPWQPGPAEDVLPGLIARPALLPGVKRWQAERSTLPNRIHHVAWSPDGKYLAYAGNDSLVRIYNAASLRLVRVLAGHKDRVWQLAWSPDGQWLATGGEDRTVRLWDAEGKARRVLRGDTSPVTRLAWSPNSKRLASASYWGDNCVRLWSIDGKAGPILKHETLITSITWSPDGKTLASADGEAKIIRLWNAADGTPITTLGPLPRGLTTLAWSFDGKHLASNGGEFEKEVKGWIWDIAERKQKVVLRASNGSWVNWFGWSSAGKLASGTQDGYIQIYDTQTGKEIALTPQTHPLGGACWSPDGRQIADTDGRIWKVAENGRKLTFDRGRLPSNTTALNSVAWSPGGDRLASGGDDWLVRLWDSTGKPGAVLKGHEAPVSSVAWSPDGTRLASAGWGWGASAIVRLWSEKGTPGPILKGHEHRILSVKWSPDGQQLASASTDDTVRLWRSNGEAGAVLKGDQGGVISVAWSLDGMRLASAGWDHTIRLWSADGTPGLILKGHEAGVLSVAWSSSGKRLASASADQTVRLWDVDGTAGPVLRGHKGEVRCVAWRPDGARLASAGDDYTVRLWGADGVAGAVLKGHRDLVRSVAWSPDGKRLVSGSNDGTIRIWSDRGEPERTLVLLPDGKAATFSAAGELLYGDADTVEKEIVYLVEKDDGRIDLLKPSAFHQLVKTGARVSQR